MNQRKAYILIFLISTLILAACTGAPTVTKPLPASAQQPAILRIGWSASPDTLNPAMGMLAESYAIYELVYDAIFDLQLDGSFTPSLAEQYTVSPDKLVWTFKLRQDVKFHDGQPLTAKDVVFSYGLYQKTAEFPYLHSYTTYFKSIEAPDDRTVILTLLEPVPNIESQLLYLFILPQHIWSKYAEEGKASEFANPEMIGSGPFKLVEYRKDEFIRLAANQAYFLIPPKVNEIIFQTFGDDAAMVQALTVGQVDMLPVAPPTAIRSLRNAKQIQVATGASLSPTLADLVLNQIAPEQCPAKGGICSGHPALRDQRVRLALAYATDKKSIIDLAVLGMGTPGRTLVPDGQSYWYNSTLQDYSFDINRAKQILDAAGYQDKDGDGIRELPDGSRSLIFRLQWPSENPDAARIADLLTRDWQQIGIKTESAALATDALVSLCCPAFDYDIILWGASWGPDPNEPLSVMRSDEITSGANETGYANKQYDELYQQQATELDRPRRRALVQKLQELVQQDVVYIVLFYPQQVQAFRTDKFKGWIVDGPTLALEHSTVLVQLEPIR